MGANNVILNPGVWSKLSKTPLVAGFRSELLEYLSISFFNRSHRRVEYTSQVTFEEENKIQWGVSHQ